MQVSSLPLLFESPAADRAGRPSAFGLTPEALHALGYPGSAEALFAALQRVTSWSGGGPALGKRARGFLETHTELALPVVESVHPSRDGSTRLLLRTLDGHRFETVHMPRDTRSPRVTLCVSSQVGCAMGCTFCATGTMGIVRNLSAGEIVGQILVAQQTLGAVSGRQLNVVFMGMGEPLHNLAQVEQALTLLCDERGLGIPPRRITVSTSGLVPGIERLSAAQPRPLLAVSINHSHDEARTRVMPVNRKYPLAVLRQALEAWPLRAKERITLEYVLLQGENDREEDALRLAEFARGLSCHINLIPMNEHERSAFARPADDHVQRFARALLGHGCLVFVRDSRGRDVSAACGQLVTAAARPRARGST